MNNKHIICTKCNPTVKGTSQQEKELITYIKEHYNGNILLNDRRILNGKELDIYLPDLNLAFEFNGLYWHSELEKPDKYHINKTIKCKKLGIQLIHIFEDDWQYKQHIIKSRILNKLGKSTTIYGRKCIIRVVDSLESKYFLNNNHIQGWCVSKINIGLYYEGELVSLMTFGNRKLTSTSNFELLRFCNKLNTTVIGGASKLFKYFINNYNYNKILSYADICWSDGNLYKQLGFDYIKDTDTNYWWIVNNIKTHRYIWRKQELIKKHLLINDETETECMHRLGYYRIYDCGSMLFEWTRL